MRIGFQEIAKDKLYALRVKQLIEMHDWRKVFLLKELQNKKAL